MNQAYMGQELELFAQAHNWKSYWSGCIAPYLKGDVLEVGAGIGTNTAFLCTHAGLRSWTCLEPDAALAQRISQRELRVGAKTSVAVRVGSSRNLAETERFDSILYLDVLEHIEADQDELLRIASHLRPEGDLVVLAPAHNYLFTPFDQALGHFRRYDRRSLQRVAPAGLRLEKLIYLDAVGFFASLANRLLLQQSNPSAKQIAFWDGVLVRLSRFVDPCLGFHFGKSVLGVWRRS